jgi:hemoglobin
MFSFRRPLPDRAVSERRARAIVLPSMTNQTSPVPTLYEWMGGLPALEKLLGVFYGRVPADPILAPVFANMSADHVPHVAAFVAEVFGGPKTYSSKLGGHERMISHHVGRALSETQRKRWILLLLECADELGIPSDPEFRSAFVAYLEWGTRLAVINSQPGANVSAIQPMPAWGWGEVKGPYLGE